MLGKFMRELRTRRDPNLKPERVAELAECTRPSVVRMELGTALPRRHLFRVILDIYGPSDADRKKALELWDRANTDTVVIEHGDVLLKSYLAFRQDESEAIKEQNYQNAAVPGIAQTEGYVAALQRTGGEVGDGVEAEHVAERRARQDQLYPPRLLELDMLLDEAVIRRVVGGRDVMAEQLRHLLTLAELPNVTLRVIPFAAGAYDLMTGPVVILSFDDDEAPGSVCLDGHVTGQTVENEPDVQALAEAFAAACLLACSPKDSAKMIREQIEVLEG
jgi:Domain of unknown function (DUF5753)/Helix-turn-helix domain